MKKRTAVLAIPVKYLPARVFKMWRQGDLRRELVYAAAMFCYFHEHEWLLRSTVGTNFPRGYKVQTSVKNRTMMPNSVQGKPEGMTYNVLIWALIEQLPFVQVALRAGIGGSKRELHRGGRELLRKHLGIFQGTLYG